MGASTHPPFFLDPHPQDSRVGAVPRSFPHTHPCVLGMGAEAGRRQEKQRRLKTGKLKERDREEKREEGVSERVEDWGSERESREGP